MLFKRDIMDRILIVDDSKTAQAIFSSILDSEYLLEIRNDAASALAAIEVNPPDLILLDIQMPIMDGFEVCRRLKQNELTRDIPIIFISALDSENEKARGFEVGADDYIVKPVLPLELVARVRAHLGAHRSRLDAIAMERLVVFRELAVTLCHEINNPLTTINAYLHVLQRELSATSESASDIVAAIKVETDRIAAITAKLAAATSAATTRYQRDVTMIDLNSYSGKL